NDGLRISRAGDGRVYRDLYEKQRTTPIGHWIDVPFNAANFTCDVGTWMVTAGNVYCYQYAFIGKSVLLFLLIDSSTRSSTPSNLFVLFPSGITARLRFYTDAIVFTNATWASAMTITAQNGNGITINRLPYSAFVAGTLHVALNIVLPIA